MTDDSAPRASSEQSTLSTDASQTKQRKKRKWDQPAESLVNYPFGNMGSLAGVTLPGVAPSISAAAPFLTNSLVGNGVVVPPLALQGPCVPKLNQPKIQDELIIAREIVINDAESSIRYKLTKRQTQEEIQKCTGAVVITRGKYRPPNAPPDVEKPLYLHISSGAHLKETAERILAVDRAAAMVEEMLKQGQNGFSALQSMSNGVKELSACVFLSFDPDPSLNITARIRGPNDQYINHIINETGATVLLRGCGSGNFEGLHGEDVHQPLHLFLSSSNPKSLEDAKHLAENLLDTISVECGASRVSSCKVYNAVPPPQQLLSGIQSYGNEQKLNASSVSGLTSTVSATLVPEVSFVIAPGVATVSSQGTRVQSGGMMNRAQHQQNMFGYSQPVLTGGTSYSGYEGIYPQATPLQQVALALRHSSSPITSSVAPTASVTPTMSVENSAAKSNIGSMSEKERQPPQKRKFQELPVGSKDPAKLNQGSELNNPSEPSAGVEVRNLSNMPAPKRLVQSSVNGMPPPPPRSMPHPPPPKFTSSTPTPKSQERGRSLNKTHFENIPDTLVKLMEYGEDYYDLEETGEESHTSDSSCSLNSNKVAVSKPFWAL
ncbi:protein RIK-like isoform X2 [Mangifera indica]|uniref:protein RIK-like isoform X2 n=1 Tax=Mangifera indica TaxID=29780 RepID=UPI001CF9426A|nr:protein RIK-like isoform X2 [Mangifera indica]